MDLQSVYKFRNTNPFGSLSLKPLGDNWHELFVEPLQLRIYLVDTTSTTSFFFSEVSKEGSGYA